MSIMDASWKGWTDDELERAVGELTYYRERRSWRDSEEVAV
jgi:hypothetical protein